IPALAEELAAAANERRYTSTQEQAWLLLAARALLAPPSESARPAADGEPVTLPPITLVSRAPAVRLAVDGQTITADPFYLSPTAEQLAQGVTVLNEGQHPVWTVMNQSGVPVAAQPPAQEGF
ncbi:hypothetical protein RZS08_45155, partial [Arthrospira platensis SPKY1]|nr:hypothetical protein [Arthrospira platensis SPKY1]